MPKVLDPDNELTEVAQIRMSKAAMRLAKDKAAAETLSISAYLRRVVYKTLGLLKEGK